MAARKLWKGEEAIPKNREPLKKKEWPPRPTLKKKEWPQKEKPKPVNPIKLKPAPGRSPKLKWNIKKR